MTSKRRVKCENPSGVKARWCFVMSEVLNAKDMTGLFQYDTVNLTTGKSRILGVAYRLNRKTRPVLLNKCPWCGEPILFATPEERGATS